MTNSQNGWPVATAAQQDTAALYGAIRVPNGVLKGDVAWVFRWLAQQYDAHVEPLVAGTCWGWYVKPIEGSSTISNHASGTAVDFNADQHPMGTAASHNFTAAQIAACHKIVKASNGVLRWGGDYSGRPDPMHWEINASAAAVRSWVTTMKKEAADMPLTDDDLHKLFYTDGLIPAPANSANIKTNPFWTLRGALQDTGQQLRTVQQQNEALAADVKKLAAAVAKLTPPQA